MMQDAKITAFTVSKLLRNHQQRGMEGEGGKVTSQSRLGLTVRISGEKEILKKVKNASKKSLVPSIPSRNKTFIIAVKKVRQKHLSKFSVYAQVFLIFLLCSKYYVNYRLCKPVFLYNSPQFLPSFYNFIFLVNSKLFLNFHY